MKVSPFKGPKVMFKGPKVKHFSCGIVKYTLERGGQARDIHTLQSSSFVSFDTSFDSYYLQTSMLKL